jgi:sigma-B regulation protein RsbU (phosphoserine phosphatase)
MPQQLGRILSIDDEDILRESIVAYLEDSGFTVYEANNGRVGLEVFRDKKPDLVLSDLQMPVMGGLEVLREIHKDFPETPVIVISGAGSMSDAIEALRLGAWDYLVKPIKDMAVLEHAVCKCLERARLMSENKAYRLELESRNEALQKSLAELKEDQQAGRSVQFKLLPEEHFKIGDYTVSFKINPSLYLSGDFVDYFQISPKLFAFYIADVSGHGAASAFVTVLLKNSVLKLNNEFQFSQNDTILYPAQVLKKISDEIYNAKLGKYLTMVYAVLDTEKNTLTYSIGGHFPIPVLASGSKSHFLEGGGFAVGIFDRAEFSDQTISLPEKFTLAMFSDGVLEILPGLDIKENESLLLKMIADPAVSCDSLMLSLGLNQERPEGLPDDIGFLLLQK